MESNREFLFIYNADTGLFSAVSDFAHKILSPQTYACNLCKLTFGAFSMQNEWKSFLESLPFKKSFLHKDEFHKQFPHLKTTSLPAVLVAEDGIWREFLTQTEINQQPDLKNLKSLFEQKLRALK